MFTKLNFKKGDNVLFLIHRKQHFPQFLQYSAVVNDNDESVLSTTEICERCSIKGKVTNQFLVGICFAANASSTIS